MDKAVALLKLLRGKPGEAPGVRIVEIKTSAPAPVTMVFQGTNLALDLDIFEVPASFQPVQKGQKFFALPIVGGGAAPRWGLIQKI